MSQDKTLVCQDCGNDFVFTVQSQEFFSQQGWNTEPRRCRDCARKRKESRGDGGSAGAQGGAPRQMFQATCTQCGNAAEVPFQPTPGKPVLCRDCFRGKQDGGARGGNGGF